MTLNKNVDRIHYLHYDIQRLAYVTRDGFEEIHGHLSATSLAVYQNRITLDMLLTEKGGVCSRSGEVRSPFVEITLALMVP